MSAKILAVDDSPLMVKMVQDHLQHAGHHVETAPDGPTALTLVETWTPDLILLDVMMPDMDGFEVCRRLRAMPATSSIPIIMLTSKATIADKKKGFDAGADDYITKPFEATELVLRIAAHLRRVETLAPGEAKRMGRVIAVFSLRGGAGSTSLAVNLAVGLKRLWGSPVPLLDLALPIGVCDAMLNLNLTYRLDDLVAKPIEELDGDVIDGYLTAHETGVRLLGGFQDPALAENLSENMVSFILEHLRQRYEHLVLDLAHNFSPATVAALDRADTIVMPITPDFNAARLTQISLQIFDALGYEKDPALIINWTFGKRGLARKQLERYLKCPIRFVIPHAEGVWSDAINTGVPLITGDPESPIIAMLEDLAWRLSDPKIREEKPTKPTVTWERVAHRLSRKTDAAELEKGS